MNLGWTPDLSEKESEKIKAAARKIIKDGGGQWAFLVATSVEAAAPFVDIEEKHLELMEGFAKVFPVWGHFGKGVLGFAHRSLGTVIALAGDLSNYSNKGKLWKRSWPRRD